MLPAKIDTQRPTREFAISVLTGVLRNAAESLPEEYANKTIDELESERKPTETDYFLRNNLWRQVEMVQKGLINEIQPVDIYRGVCSAQNYEKIAKNPNRLSWLLICPIEDKARLEAGLSLGITNLLKFVAKEPTVETAGAFIKAIEFLYNRVHGPLVQRIDARHAHMNMNKPVAPVSSADESARLEALKAKLAGAEIRDVSPAKAE